MARAGVWLIVTLLSSEVLSDPYRRRPDPGRCIDWGSCSSFEIGCRGHDTIVPEDRHRVRLSECVAFEFANNTRALASPDPRVPIRIRRNFLATRDLAQPGLPV